MTTWTEERVERLKALYKDGLSASEIAAQLGGFEHCGDRGRSAVLGKIHRLNLTGRPKPGTSIRTRQRQANAARAISNKIKAGMIKKPRGNPNGGLAFKAASGALGEKPAAIPFKEPEPVHVPYAGPRYGILDDRLGHLMCRAIVEGEGIATIFCSARVVDGPFRFCRDHAAVYLTAPTGRTWSPERRQKMILAKLRRASWVAA